MGGLNQIIDHELAADVAVERSRIEDVVARRYRSGRVVELSPVRREPGESGIPLQIWRVSIDYGVSA